MFLLRGSHVQSPVLTGRSVHNTRIERLWRDVHRIIGARFKEVFFTLEDSGDLEVNSDIDLWCLHLVFIPVINEALEQFRQLWDYHPSSSANNKSPLRIWIDGICLAPPETQPVPDVDEYYAIDFIELPIELADDDAVEERNYEGTWKARIDASVLDDFRIRYSHTYQSDTAAQDAYRELRREIYSLLNSV